MKKIICVASLLLVTVFGYNTSTAFGQISLTKYDSITIAPYLDGAMIAIDDMDNDQQNEIVSIYGLPTSGMPNYFLKITKIDVNGTLSSIDYQLDCSSRIRNFSILDADNNSFQDIVFVHSDSVTILWNLSSGFNGSQLTMFSGCTTDGIAKGDFNKDGKDDFVCSNWNDDNLTMFIQSNTGFYAYDNIAAVQAGYNQVEVWDINFDGWDDVVFLAGQSLGSGIYVYLNDSGFFNTAPLYFPILGSMGNTLITANVSFGDFLGTGQGLMINSNYGQPNENTRFIQYQSSGNWVNMGLENMISCYPSSATADFDNNGRDETVYLNSSYNNLRVVEFFTLSSNQSLNFTTIGGNYHAYDQLLATGDVVGNDGKTDFVMISDWGQIIIFANNGTITEITEQKSDLGLSIYPNPTTEYINIQINESGEYNCVISDVSGRIVLQQKYNGQEFTIDVSNMNPGMYFLTINGKTSFSKRLIVQ